MEPIIKKECFIMKKEKRLKALELVCDFAVCVAAAAIADSVGEDEGFVTKTLVNIGTLAVGVAACIKLNEEFTKLRNKNSAANAEHDFMA
jgi:hypothetical protein